MRDGFVVGGLAKTNQKYSGAFPRPTWWIGKVIEIDNKGIRVEITKSSRSEWVSGRPLHFRWQEYEHMIDPYFDVVDTKEKLVQFINGY